MADKKVTALTALTAASNNDILLIVDDPLGTPISKKITVEDVFGNTTKTTLNKIHIGSSNTNITGTSLTLYPGSGGAACTGVVLVTNNSANSNISAASILTKGWAVVMTQGNATTQNRLDLGYFDAGLTSTGFHSILNTGDLAFNANAGTIKFYYSVRGYL